MSIGLLNNLYEPYQRGGAEVITSRLAAELIARGEKVFVITTRPRRQAANPSQETASVERLKYPIYYLNSHFSTLADHNSAWRLIWQIANLFNVQKYQEIKKILRVEKPTLVISHNLMGLSLLIPPLLKKLGIPQEHYLHDIQLLYPAGLMFYGQEKKISAWPAKLYQALTRGLIGSPKKIISPSAWLLAEHTRRNFFKNSLKSVQPFVWPNQPKKIASPAKKEKIFLFVGQIEVHKGIFLLIKAFKKLPDAQAKLLVVGAGQKLALAQQAARGDERISFLGRLPSASLADLISQATCLIVPSLCYENSPTIIYQAQATGLPVIAARLGGIPEIVKDQNNLFQPGDETDLLKKMTSI